MSYSPKRSTVSHNRSSPNKSQTAAAQPQILSKQHKLEGDGLITGFYDFMLLRNNDSMKPCTDIPIPDTVVYTNNFPRGWYHHDTEKSKEVMKRPGTDLDSSKVCEFFSHQPSKNVGIVASYMSVHEEEDVITTSVEFFNKDTIKGFVERKNKAEGILQKFIVPKGGTRNAVIQAVWSPNPNAFFVWRRTNRMHLDHKPQWEKDPYPMCVTYDGPSHFSEESTCAQEIKKEIRSKCEKIVEHFFQVYEREKIVTRLVLYFKLDEDGVLWLLWCGGLRVADANTAQADPNHHSVPLNLAPRYTDSSIEAQRESREMALLGETNRKFRELKKSASTQNGSKNSPIKGGDGAGNSYGHHHGSGASSPLGGTVNGAAATDAMAEEAAADRGAAGGDGRKGASSAAGAAAEKDGADAEKDSSWHTNPQIHDSYMELCKQRDTVISYLDDIFYEAYGHFLKYDPGNFNFEVDKKIAAMLGNDQLGEAMAKGGVGKATATEAGMASIDDEDLYFEIIPKHPKGPVSKIGEEVKGWVEQHYEKAIADLKEEAASILPPISTMGAAPADSPHVPVRGGPSAASAGAGSGGGGAAAAAPIRGGSEISDKELAATKEL